MQAELGATAEDRNKTREELELVKASVHAASLELELREREKRSMLDNLKAMTVCLKTKQEELDATKVGNWYTSCSICRGMICIFITFLFVQKAQLDLHRHIEELQVYIPSLEAERELMLTNLPP